MTVYEEMYEQMNNTLLVETVLQRDHLQTKEEESTKGRLHARGYMAHFLRKEKQNVRY